VEIVSMDCTDDFNEICILYNAAIKTASSNGMKCTQKKKKKQQQTNKQTTNTIQA